MEVCCEPSSLLATAVQSLAGSETAASRCSLWNSCDLGTSAGLDLVLRRIEIEQPVVVWMSPPEAPYSPLQNLRTRTSEQGSTAHIHELQRGVSVLCSERDSCGLGNE